MKSVQGHWRRKHEILSLVIKEEISEPQKMELKPLLAELKYAYWKSRSSVQWSFHPCSALHRRVACCMSSKRTSKPGVEYYRFEGH